MDSKKKRNSILKLSTQTSKAEECCAELPPRIGRRISFSGKRSVRVFSREEEAKTWNTSYEVSDVHVNCSADEAKSKCQANATKLTVIENANATIDSFQSENKENIRNEEIKKCSKAKSDQLQATYDLIDKSLHSTLVCVQNSSLDITLLNQEKQYREVPMRPSVTFMLTENEGNKLHNYMDFSMGGGPDGAHRTRMRPSEELLDMAPLCATQNYGNNMDISAGAVDHCEMGQVAPQNRRTDAEEVDMDIDRSQRLEVAVESNKGAQHPSKCLALDEEFQKMECSDGSLRLGCPQEEDVRLAVVQNMNLVAEKTIDSTTKMQLNVTEFFMDDNNESKMTTSNIDKYFENDDMLLESTSFLTNATLRDVYAARNSSHRGTIYFNGGLNGIQVDESFAQTHQKAQQVDDDIARLSSSCHQVVDIESTSPIDRIDAKPQERTSFARDSSNMEIEHECSGTNLVNEVRDRHDESHEDEGRPATEGQVKICTPRSILRAQSRLGWHQQEREREREQEDSFAVQLTNARASLYENETSPQQTQMINTKEYLRKFEGTPHRSVIEFEILEHEIEFDRSDVGMADKCETHPALQQTMHKTMAMELDVSGIVPFSQEFCVETKKRSTSILTPNLPVSKKRSTGLEGVRRSLVAAEECESRVKRKTILFETSMNIDNSTMDSGSPAKEKASTEFTIRQFDEDLSIESMNGDREDMKEELQEEQCEHNLAPMCRSIDSPACNVEVMVPEEKLSENVELELQESFKANVSIAEDDERIEVEVEVKAEAEAKENCGSRELAEVASAKSELDIANLIDHRGMNATENTFSSPSSNEIGIEVAQFRKDFVNLSDCTMLRLKGAEEIDKTCISLVETIVSDEDEVICHEEEAPAPQPDPEPERDCAASASTIDEHGKQRIRLCSKCKRCQDSILNETKDVSMYSFKFPKWSPAHNVDLHRLKNLRSKPSVSKVKSAWEHKIKALLDDNRNNFDTTAHLSSVPMLHDHVVMPERSDRPEQSKTMLSLRRKMLENGFADENDRDSYVQQVHRMCCHSPYWIFVAHQQFGSFLQLRLRDAFPLRAHIGIAQDPQTLAPSVVSLNLQHSLPEKFWKPIDHIMLFQANLELCFDMQQLCLNGSIGNLSKTLSKMGQTCQDVSKLCTYLWRIVCSEQATLLRKQNNNYVRKVVREACRSGERQGTRIKCTEFLIELTNIRSMSFKDIVAPPLYNFSEQIETLPGGFDFLHTFLKRPCAFLKQT